MPKHPSSKYRRARKNHVWQCHRSMPCRGFARQAGDKLLYPLQWIDQLREELKEEFYLTDEELDQQTLYLL